MALQIRRGTEAERLTLTGSALLAGEPLYVTDDKKLYIGDGSTPGGIAVTSFTATDAVNTIGAALTNGSHTGISFTYDFSGAGGSARINGTVTQNINALSDVTITGTPTNGQVLKWDSGTSQWVNGAPPASTLDGLSDVVITGSPASGQVVRFDGTNWVNGNAALNDLSDVVISGTMSDGLVLRHNGTEWVASDALTVESIEDIVAGLITRGVHTGIGFSYDDSLNRLNAAVGFTKLLDDPAPLLGGTLGLNSNNITGTGNISINGDITVNGTFNGASPNATDVRLRLNSNLNLEGKLLAPTGTVETTAFFNVFVSNSGANLKVLDDAPLYATVIKPHNGVGFVDSAALVFTADGSTTNGAATAPTKFSVYLGDGVNDIISSPAQLNFDKTGTLSVPVIQTGVYTGSPDTRPAGVKGMIIFNDTTGRFQGYNGTAWVDLNP